MSKQTATQVASTLQQVQELQNELYLSKEENKKLKLLFEDFSLNSNKTSSDLTR